MAAPGHRILRLWHRLRPLPGGTRIFSWIVGRMAPYTGTIRARITHLEPGRCTATLRDRRRVRNHLRSIHAIALANLGEVASGLAVLTPLPEGTRGIPVAIHVNYLKKARGTLTATGTAAPPEPGAQDVDHDARAAIHNGDGDLVAEVTVTWRIGRLE